MKGLGQPEQVGSQPPATRWIVLNHPCDSWKTTRTIVSAEDPKRVFVIDSNLLGDLDHILLDSPEAEGARVQLLMRFMAGTSDISHVAGHVAQLDPEEHEIVDPGHTERLLEIASRVLPDGDRWLEEWKAELSFLPLGERRELAHELLAGAASMAMTLYRAKLRPAR